MHLLFECRHTFASGFQLDVQCEAELGSVGLFGPSGSGKSSLVRLLGGVWRPQQARVELDGQPLHNVPPEARRFGVVFQDQHLFPHLDVNGNLGFAERRAPSGPVRRAEVLEVLRLGELLPRRVQSLSGGERQRVALGRALLSQPRLLLLDEPLGAVDAGHRLEILDHLETIVRTWSLPLLLVSHDQLDLRRLAEQVFVLDGGRIVGQGRPELLSDPRVRPGEMVSNVLRLQRVADRADQATLGDATVLLPPSLHGTGEQVFLSVSAGAIALAPAPSGTVSIRNALPGTVRRTIEQGGVVFVCVDVGQELWVAITPSAAAELDLAEGAALCCLIKTHSLTPLA